MSKILLLSLLLVVCFQANAEGYPAQEYYINPPGWPNIPFGKECDWRNAHIDDKPYGAWEKMPLSRETLGLWLPSLLTFDPKRELGTEISYLLMAWLIYPLAVFLCLAREKTRMIGIMLLVPWLVFSWDRRFEFFCIWCLGPAWVIKFLVKNLLDSVR